jgi:transcriptional regulator with XRE-family HTH domain
VSQELLAGTARIERSHMGKIERGLHSPSLAMIFAIADALDVSPGEIVNRARELLGGDHAA